MPRLRSGPIERAKHNRTAPQNLEATVLIVLRMGVFRCLETHQLFSSSRLHIAIMRAPEPTANLRPEGDHRTKVVARPALRSSRLDRQSRWAKRRKNLDFSQGIYRATPKAERLWHAYRGFRPSSRLADSFYWLFSSHPTSSAILKGL